MKTLLSLDDVRWKDYRSGYSRRPVDVRNWIRPLLASKPVGAEHWDFLWDELHHQGTLGEASYAVIPYLVEYVRRSADLNWNIFAFVACVELQRTEAENPAVPQEIEKAYMESLRELPELALRESSGDSWNAEQVRSVAACMALSKGQRLLARAYLELSEDGARQFLAHECGVAV